MVWVPHTDHDIPVLQCANRPTKTAMVQMFHQAVLEGVKKKVPFVVAHRVALVQLAEEL